MKFQHIFLATIATLSITVSSDIKAAHADLARGTDLQIHRSIDSDKYQETVTSVNRTRSMEEVGIGWKSYKKDEHLKALEHFSKAVEIDEENPYAFAGVALVLGKTSAEGVVFMTYAAALFEQQNDQEGYDGAVEWLKEAASNQAEDDSK
jgi:tetratricopeptide (TPR) repeat protein